jgi:hypothetical protein
LRPRRDDDLHLEADHLGGQAGQQSGVLLRIPALDGEVFAFDIGSIR